MSKTTSAILGSDRDRHVPEAAAALAMNLWPLALVMPKHKARMPLLSWSQIIGLRPASSLRVQACDDSLGGCSDKAWVTARAVLRHEVKRIAAAEPSFGAALAFMQHPFSHLMGSGTESIDRIFCYGKG